MNQRLSIYGLTFHPESTMPTSGDEIVMVTHNANIAEMADTVIRMNSGEIAERYTNAVQKTAYEIGW